MNMDISHILLFALGCTLWSEVFPLPELGYSLKVTFDLELLSFKITYVNKRETKSSRWNKSHVITFICKDQCDQKTKCDIIRIFEPFFDNSHNETLNPKLGYWELFCQKCFKNAEANIKIILKPLAHVLALEPRHIGTLIWKIDNFKDTCDKHLKGCEFSLSEAFYSNARGYRMKVLVCIGNTLNAQLCFLKGPWDEYLPEASKHQATFTIINENDPSGSEDLTLINDCDPSESNWFRDLIKICDLEKYVKDDTLVIHVTLKPSP